MNWNNLLQNLETLNTDILINNIPHSYHGDTSGYSVKECLDWIKTNHQEGFPEGLVPIYGRHDYGRYEGSASFLLIEPTTGKFFEIHGSHCSCYGFEGQFTPEECPIEYLAKGKQWAEAYETVLEVVKHFQANPIN